MPQCVHRSWGMAEAFRQAGVQLKGVLAEVPRGSGESRAVCCAELHREALKILLGHAQEQLTLLMQQRLAHPECFTRADHACRESSTSGTHRACW